MAMNTVDLSRISYYVTVMLSTGEQLQLEDLAENIAWEENEKELAVRLNLTLRDAEYKGGRLSQQFALGTIVYLYADWGEGRQEVFRGTVWEWNHSQINNDAIVLTCYDMLYYLQKSVGNKFYAKGKKTKAIISDILKSWSVELGEYTGPNVEHKKIVYKAKTISQMLTDTLDKAEDLGGAKAIIRASEGKADIIAYGSNETVYGFTAGTNLLSSSDKYSMTELITRIKIVGKDDSNGLPKVEATLNGHTEFGILQAFQTMGSSSLKDAKTKAKKVLKEKGEPKRTIIFVAPDFPLIRKGLKIHVETDKLVSDYIIKGVSHNATTGQMQMEVEPAEEESNE